MEAVPLALVKLLGKQRRLGDEADAFSEEELHQRPEVKIINKYVIVMAYFRIGLKGMGALALLWATVVVLGGFVSKVKTKDFSYVTIIAFVQAAGLSDAMGDARFAFFGEWIISIKWKIQSFGNTTHRERLLFPWKARLKTSSLHILHVIMFCIFAPVAYFAIAGPVICVVLSVLRIAKQDYVIPAESPSPPDPDIVNLKPALNTFYYVSLVHGAIYILYMLFEVVLDEALVEVVAGHHDLLPEVLDGYLHETKRMCVNNPAAIESWSLITYGAGLLDSQLPEDYASGGRVLVMLIDQDTPTPITHLLIRSPRQRIQKLIGTLAWRSPDDREMTWLAARIVEHIARHLKLAQFPGALECISSLLDTSCHNNGDKESLYLPFVIGRRKWRKRRSFLRETLNSFLHENKYGYLQALRSPLAGIAGNLLEWLCRKHLAPTNGSSLEQDSRQRENGEGIHEDLVLLGLRILENLANDRHNCTLIYNTNDLLEKIVAPVKSNELVQDIKSNAAWANVVDQALEVVSRLMECPGETGQEMRNLIGNGDDNTIKNLINVLDKELEINSNIIKIRMRAIHVLTRLVLHPTKDSPKGKGKFILPEIQEQLIQSVLQIFFEDGWMENYLKQEKWKIDQQPTSQQNTLSIPAQEAVVKKKMKEAQETACWLKEKAGEELAMFSSHSEAINSFLKWKGMTNLHKGLTELLTKFKTINCQISKTDNMEIKITTGCRISAAVILKKIMQVPQVRSTFMESTIRQVLDLLLPIEEKANSTPLCWERVTGCITSCGSDIENQRVQPPALQRQNHIQQCGERRLQAELLSLVADIRARDKSVLEQILLSQPQVLDDFLVMLNKMVEENMYATHACLELYWEIVKVFISNNQSQEVIEKHNIVGTLLRASKRMARLESSMHFAGVKQDCHGKALSSDLAKLAQDIST